MMGGDRHAGCITWSEVAEDKRFELLRGCPQHAFQACALGHYANPPPQSLPEPAGAPVARRRMGPPWATWLAGPAATAASGPSADYTGSRPPARRYPANPPRAGRQQGYAGS